MGLPAGNGNRRPSIPKLILYTLTLMGFIRNLISSILRFMRIQKLLQSKSPSYPSTHPQPITDFDSFSAFLLRALLPVMKFSDLLHPLDHESCAVCLLGFDAGDEIRVTNCTHVFHRSCIDRWIGLGLDRKTCPLCRTPFIPEDLQDSFNERLWAASGIADSYSDSSLSNLL